MILGADEPIDALELLWAMQVRNANFQVPDIAFVSNRSAGSWAAALEAGRAPFPSNAVIFERYAVIRHAVRDQVSFAVMADRARAPRSWCEAVVARLHEISTDGQP